ncbi:MAG: FkbM family methyltransferase [Gammaproteobacteria bacterium]|nr:FkbM family methyltransferase [Gammaproteobacteria bacterium]
MQSIGIYGAGGYGRAFCRAMKSRGVEPAFFIDQYSNEAEVLGLPVYRIPQVRDKSAAIYVSLALPPVAADTDDAVTADLRAAGLHNVHRFEDGLRDFPAALHEIIALGQLWMDTDPTTSIDDAKLARVRALLHDDQSRRLLDRIVAFRREPSYASYVAPDGQTEYFPDDVDVFSSLDTIRFVDCGAYTGDTVAALAQRLRSLGKTLDYAISFEPDPANHATLVDELARQKADLPGSRLMALPLGVWSHDTVLRFNVGNGSSSGVAGSTGDATTADVPVVALDGMLASAEPNFIKMDIEGAEREALRGAQQIIQRCRPNLAVCVYHRPDDLWEIPLAIHALHPGYRMHLRVHSHMGLSTVLYCTT